MSKSTRAEPVSRRLPRAGRARCGVHRVRSVVHPMHGRASDFNGLGALSVRGTVRAIALEHSDLRDAARLVLATGSSMINESRPTGLSPHMNPTKPLPPTMQENPALARRGPYLITVHKDGMRAARLRSEKPLTVGRAEECDVRIDTPCCRACTSRSRRGHPIRIRRSPELQRHAPERTTARARRPHAARGREPDRSRRRVLRIEGSGSGGGRSAVGGRDARLRRRCGLLRRRRRGGRRSDAAAA